jgi:hypothetical protein
MEFPLPLSLEEGRGTSKPYRASAPLSGRARLLSEGGTSLEQEPRSEDGTVFPVVFSANASEDGQLLILMSREATERKSAEKALGECEERFDKTTSAMKQIVWVADSGSQRFLSSVGPMRPRGAALARACKPSPAPSRRDPPGGPRPGARRPEPPRSRAFNHAVPRRAGEGGRSPGLERQVGGRPPIPPS